MIGIDYITKRHDMNSSQLAEKLGISRKTVNGWVTGRYPIPDKRIKQLSELFGSRYTEYFQKKVTDLEKSEIDIIYFQQTDPISVSEVVQIDEEGHEYTESILHSGHAGIIGNLQNEHKRIKIHEDAKKLLKDEHGDNNEENIEFFQNVIKLLSLGEQEAEMMKAVVYHLVNRNSMFGGVKPKYMHLSQNGFLDDAEAFYQKHKDKI